MDSRSHHRLPRRQNLQEALVVLNMALRIEVDVEEAEVGAESTEGAMGVWEVDALTMVVPTATVQVTSAEGILTT